MHMIQLSGQGCVAGRGDHFCGVQMRPRQRLVRGVGEAPHVRGVRGFVAARARVSEGKILGVGDREIV